MKNTKLILMIVSLVSAYVNGQITFHNEPFTNTYSIVAVDPENGEMGVAVQSHWFSVGSIVAWGEPGAGVVATQSLVNVSFGPRALQLLKEGLSPKQVVEKLTEEDEGRDYRQLAVADFKGNVAAYTGSKCIQDAGHLEGDKFTVQANLMLNDRVWPEMKRVFENSTGRLAERLLLTLEAAEEMGGDIRGKQSASITIWRTESTGKPWEDKLVDLRVDDHTEPLVEIRRLLKVHRAYEHMNNGDLAIEKGEMDKAMQEYSLAEEMFPDNIEMKFWRAVTLTNIGRLDEALPVFKTVFNANENWKILTPRLIHSELLNVTDEQLKKIMSVQ